MHLEIERPDDMAAELNPLLSMWFKPRATMRQLLADGYDSWNYLLAAIGGIAFASYAPEKVASDAWWPFNFQGLLWMAGGAAFALLLWLVESWTITTVANYIGGTASSRKTRGALAWSGLVLCMDSFIWLLQCAFVSVGFAYAPNFLNDLYEPGSVLGFCLLSLPSFILAIWAFVARLFCVSEAADISPGLAFGAMILGSGMAGAIFVGPVAFVYLIYTAFSL